MPYYLRRLNGEQSQIWRIDETTAVRLGVMNPEGFGGSYFKARPGETAWDAIALQTNWLDHDGAFTQLCLDVGHHHPRIARPLALATSDKTYSPSVTTDRNIIAGARGQAAALTAQLSRICQTIHPSPGTFATFGHDIRNLLILACTEVEMSLRGVLAANGSTKTQPNMTDYVALAEIMRLDAYAVTFTNYPWLEPIRPFAGWSNSRPLAWYAAYNGVKHNREAEFSRASLRHAFEAVTACAVLLVAQYGRQNGLGFPPELSAFFRLEEEPEWAAGHVYCGFLSETDGDWIAVNHPTLAAIKDRPKKKTEK